MNFIEIYDDALSSENCDKLIEYFNNNPQSEGMVTPNKYGRVRPDEKKSTELLDSLFSLHTFPFQCIFPTLNEYTDKYVEKYVPLQYMEKWGVDDEFTLKKFEGEDEGYKTWHTEHGFAKPKRILVWMFYLNDAQSGTEFFHHPNVESKKGRLIIWPAGWTHHHKSELNKGTKYIMSGWYSFVD